MIIIPFSEVKKFDIEPSPAWGWDNKHNKEIWFRCKCGSLIHLKKWKIDSVGKVTPSVDHTEGSLCDFHEYVKLEDYDGTL